MDEDAWYAAQVVSRSRLSPHLVRVRLGLHRSEPGTGRLTTTGTPDERLVLELPGGATRSVTVSGWGLDDATLDLDVVLHAGGELSAWAERVKPGDPARVSDLRGWYAPPHGAAWQLLVADLSGLPALARIAGTTAARLPTSVVAEVVEPADRPTLPAEAHVCLLAGSGNQMTPSRLLDAVQAFDWPVGPGYVWFAGEAGTARAVRQHLRGLGWPVARYRVLGYWRAAQEHWQRRYEQLAPGLEHLYTDARTSGLSSDEALEAYDDALQELGL